MTHRRRPLGSGTAAEGALPSSLEFPGGTRGHMTKSTATLIFPHQLFLAHPGAVGSSELVLIEEDLFFGDSQYPARFHKQKLWLHRATMTRYCERLRRDGRRVTYVDHRPGESTLGAALADLTDRGVTHLRVVDVHDVALRRRIEDGCERLGMALAWLDTPMFLNTTAENQAYRAARKRWFMADFYKSQRKRLGLLMDGDEPVGGQWSFDHDNRKKVPRSLLGEIPALETPVHDAIDRDAREHVASKYVENPGSLQTLYYPTSHRDAERWLKHFVGARLARFGDYEDAIVKGERWLWHGVLTPMLNIGLLTPAQVVDAVIERARTHDVPLNSVEGFIRQVVGWREFMRATYEDLGGSMRTTNHWGHSRSMPAAFYEARTGIEPVDDVVRRVLETGYCHHIERLMVLGGFMFLCEIDPDDIYRWFMELFVDSYDWVMVPNVYGMSQNADGGQITTKPYFSGSSYIRKMSNFGPGDWAQTWDALYWRWIWRHADDLGRNPRWAMMCAMARKMDPAKRDGHIHRAESFLDALHGGGPR